MPRKRCAATSAVAAVAVAVLPSLSAGSESVAPAWSKVGMGAARGLGIGPLPRKERGGDSRSCAFSEAELPAGEELAAEKAREKVRLALELARHAASCCAELPQAVTSNSSAASWPRSGTPLKSWPAGLARLLALFVASVGRSLELCARGAEAAVHWATAASAEKSRACAGQGASAAADAALVALLRAVAEAHAHTAERLTATQAALAEAAASSSADRPHSWPVDFLESLVAGVSSGALVGASEHGTSQTTRHVVEDTEPALLVRFFCAGAASGLLELRALSLAAHSSWLSQPHPPESVAGLWTPAVDRLSELRSAADFLRPRVWLRPQLLHLETSASRGSAVGSADASRSSEALLVLELPPYTLHARAWSLAEEVLQHLPAMKSGGLKVLLLENYFLKHGPRLAQFFRATEAPEEEGGHGWPIGQVEVAFRPMFGLHIRDADIWSQAPSLADLFCLQAGTSTCWKMTPCLEEQPDSTSPTSLSEPASSSGAGGGGEPQEPGCWFRLPSGCPGASDPEFQDPQSSGKWRRDAWGEKELGAKTDAGACLRVRRESFNSWCGVADAQMHHVGPSSGSDRVSDDPRCAKHAPIREVLAALSTTTSAMAEPPGGVTRFVAALELDVGPGQEISPALREYLLWHAEAVAAMREDAGSRPGGAGVTSSIRSVVWACHASLPCGGHGDRLKGITAAFILALLTERLFFVDAPDPWDLKLFLEPSLLDWRVVGLSGLAAGRHVLWDHDLFEESYLDQLLDVEAEQPVWVVYSNKKSLLGPLLRHPRLAARAQQLGLLTTPRLTHQVWSLLFRPTAALERHWQSLELELGGGPVGGVGGSGGFIALHHRSGDLAAGFGLVNGEVDIRTSGQQEVVALLACAHIVERLLGLPNTTKWFLATDGPGVLDVPQVGSWRESGKLIVRGAGKRAHLASEGLVPPCGSRVPGESSVASQRIRPSPLLSLPAAESLKGVADAWVDFLAISRASAAVVSSSAFGIMAAQAGAVDRTFSSSGCLQLDLLL